MELDKAIVESVNKANKKLGEFFYVLANEPSVGLYHVQEHIRKTIPKNTETKREIRKKYQNIEAMTYDVNFSIQTVKSLHDLTTFATIKQTMESCIEMINAMNKGQPGKKVATFPAPGATATRSPGLVQPSIPATLPISGQAPTQPPPNQPASTHVTPLGQMQPPQVLSANSNPVQVPAVASGVYTTERDGRREATSIQPSDQLPSITTIPTPASNTSSSSSSNLLSNTPPVESHGSQSLVLEGDATDEANAGYDNNDEVLAHKKGKKTKKPKAAKNLAKNFDLTPKQF